MARRTKTAQVLIDAARELSDACDRLAFGEPVTHVYNPLAYARPMHEQYLSRFGRSRKRILLLGMNPGPWGMAQTGVPFGEIAAVRDWLKITHQLDNPPTPDTGQHPKRPVEGLMCSRSEVSGRRVWELMQQRYGEPEAFFKEHFITNYCPLVFMEAGGKNRTPDKLPASEREPLEAVCNAHLRQIVEILKPACVVGIGKFAEQKARTVLGETDAMKITTILHPSPASPLANRGWAERATQQMIEAGLWS